MTVFLATIVLLQFLVNCGLFVWVLKAVQQNHQGEAIRMNILAESAMGHLKSKTLQEKVAADALKSQHDTQLAYMRDVLARQEAEALTKQKDQQPSFVSDDQGRKFRAEDIEVLT